jgi:hypothetical protein
MSRRARPAGTPSPPGLTPARAALLEAHVRYEVERWSGDGLTTAVREEADALYAWLASVRLEDIAPAEPVAATLARLVEQLPLTDETATVLTEVATTMLHALAGSDLRVRDLATREDVLGVAGAAARLDRLRAELIGALTASTAYRRLVAHVLYRGVKDYVLTENVLARRIPGASSLVRFGQRGLNTAAPGLEQAVDRQLAAFVEANIAETLRESRRYLEATLDAHMVRVLAEEAWGQLSPRRLSDLATLADDDDLERLGAELVVLAEHSLRSGRLTPILETALHDLLTRHADESPADLLADLGLGRDEVVEELTRLVEPLMEQPAVQRFVEERVRARLTAFYASDACPVTD